MAVDVPERTPVELLSVMPLGSAPLSLQVAVPRMPVAVNVSLKAVPDCTLAWAGLVTVMVLQAMTSEYVGPLAAQPLPSVTVTTMGNVPLWVGVPASSPLVERVMPFGSVLAVVNVAPPSAPVCENCSLKAALTVPLV